MIRYIKGEIEAVGDQYVILDNNGLGYRVLTSQTSIDVIKNIKSSVKMYTHLHVREDAMLLYGFETVEELELFEILISVSKVGPKAALNILSMLKPVDVRMAIKSGDIKLLSKVNGIGAKTAERLILELKDKIEDVMLWELDNVSEKQNSNLIEEVVLALIGLGYSKNQAENAAKSVYSEDIETYIKLALKKLF